MHFIMHEYLSKGKIEKKYSVNLLWIVYVLHAKVSSVITLLGEWKCTLKLN